MAQHQAPVIQALPPELEDMRPRLQQEVQRSIGAQPQGAQFVIIAPPQVIQQLVFAPRMERDIDRMRVHGLDPRQNPVIGFRNLGWTIIGIGMAGMAAGGIILFSGGLIAELGATAAVSTGVATATSEAMGAAAVGAEVIPLIVRTAASSPAAASIARAAGVLIVVGLTESVARAETPRTTSYSAIRAVPVRDVEPTPRRIEQRVHYNGEEFVVIGIAVVR